MSSLPDSPPAYPSSLRQYPLVEINEISELPENEISAYLNKDSDYKITYSIKIDDYKNITLTTNLDLVTPGLKNVLSNPYTVKVERSIVYETE